MFGPGWHENEIYPGTHWLYYNKRGFYKARVDFNTWTKGLYQWRVMHDIPGKDEVGWALSLEAAQRAAEAVMEGKTYQFRLL